MKLGAQLFSVRTFLQNEEDLRNTFKRIKAIGYDNVQLSGSAPFSADLIREISLENQLPIVCTHTPLNRIVEETESVIDEHKTFDCSVIGLGMMPKEYHGSREGLDAFLALMKEPVKKIRDAGLNFAYHNHAFELLPFANGDGNSYDIMIEQLPDWHFIMDTYWVERAGQSPIDYLQRIGGERLMNVHFKDMAKDESQAICPCGAGRLNFTDIAAVCEKLGVCNVLVEQDNAVSSPDPFADMEASFKHLRPIIK